MAEAGEQLSCRDESCKLPTSLFYLRHLHYTVNHDPYTAGQKIWLGHVPREVMLQGDVVPAPTGSLL